MSQKIIEALPRMSAKERANVRSKCDAALAAGGRNAKDARAILDALDKLGRTEAAAEAQRFASLEGVDRIREAFLKEPPTQTQVRLIQVVADNPGKRSTDLSVLMGWDPGEAWSMHFGMMCKDRGALLAPDFEQTRKSDEFWCGVLTDFDSATSGFTLKPEAAEAFTQLGYVKASRREGQGSS